MDILPNQLKGAKEEPGGQLISGGSRKGGKEVWGQEIRSVIRVEPKRKEGNSRDKTPLKGSVDVTRRLLIANTKKKRPRQIVVFSLDAVST